MRGLIPQGIGLYLRHLDPKKSDPTRLADKYAKRGVSWVAIGGPWHDEKNTVWVNKPLQAQLYTDAFKKVGISAHIWGYCWHDRIERFVRNMAECTNGAVDGWLLDPELGLKGRPQEAAGLFAQSRAQMGANRVLGMTSYGLPRGHKTFPFEAFAKPGVANAEVEVDYGSPQLYVVGEAQVKQGLADWKKLGFDVIIPSFGNYKFVAAPGGDETKTAVSKTGPELDEHLSHFMSSATSIQAMIGWSSGFVTREQWEVLSKWGRVLKRSP
jgi:hypothetical protein